MTVRDLIEMLEKMPPEALIVFREPLDDTGEYTDVKVLLEDEEVVLDIS